MAKAEIIEPGLVKAYEAKRKLGGFHPGLLPTIHYGEETIKRYAEAVDTEAIEQKLISYHVDRYYKDGEEIC